MGHGGREDRKPGGFGESLPLLPLVSDPIGFDFLPNLYVLKDTVYDTDLLSICSKMKREREQNEYCHRDLRPIPSANDSLRRL